MTANIKEYLVMGLMQIQGHLNKGPAEDPNTAAMVDVLMDDTRDITLAVDSAANANLVANYFGGEYESEHLIDDIGLTPAGAAVANVNDYVTVLVKVEDGAGGSAVTVGTFTTSATNWAAGVRVAATLGSNLTIPANGVISVESAKTGDGVAMPIRNVYVRSRPTVV